MNASGPIFRPPARIAALAPRWIGSGVLAVLTCVAVLASAGSAVAASFPVTNTEDAGPGSLRVAIGLANVSPGADTIPIGVTGTIDIAERLPKIEGPTAISGPGEDRLTIRRTAATPFRIFHLSTELSGEVADSISGLTIANGKDAFGAGILDQIDSLTLKRVVLTENVAEARGGTAAAAAGGALLTGGGDLTLVEVTVSANKAIAGSGSTSNEAGGGGLEVAGKVLIEDSTISENLAQASGPQGIAASSGGGIEYIDDLNPRSVATIVNSTISGNNVLSTNAEAFSAHGGGVFSTGRLGIVGSTITANAARGAAGAAAANLDLRAANTIADSIVSSPVGGPQSCAVAITSLGFNIDDGTSCGLKQASDHPATDPGLDPVLAGNGGASQTHALLPGSVAIDSGNAFGSTADQRGMPRPSDFLDLANAAAGDGSDIGAFERQAPALPPLPLPSPSPPRDTTAPATRLGKHPSRRTSVRLAVFRFSASEAGSHFQCKLDKKPFRGCGSPFKRKVSAAHGAGAKHVFMVRAIDAAGNVDATPAKFVWHVVSGR